MIIHKCDKCGAEIEGIPHSISYPDEQNIEHKSYELCDQCFDGFKEWLDKTLYENGTKFPCQLCEFEDAENCPRDCFFDDTFLNTCAHKECQFLDAGGYCYFTLVCKAFKPIALFGG